MANVRETQAVIEALDAGSPRVRVTQTVLEVLDVATSPLRLTQSAVEVLEPNYPDDGGNSSGTNPPAASLPTTTPQFFGVLEEMDDGTIVEAFAEQLGGPFSDAASYFGGFKERRIVSFGSITRKATTPAGGIQASTQQIVFDDTDRYFRTSWAATKRRGRKWSNYTVDHADRLAEVQPYRLSAGEVTEHGPIDDFQYGFTVEGMLGRHIARIDTETKVPPNLITAAQNPILAERFSSGWAPPIGYGLLSDETAARPQGVVPGTYVGSANLQSVFGGGALNVVGDFYVFFGHAVQDTLNLYVTPAAWTAGTLYLVGDRIRPNVTSNGFLYQCTVAGTSGGSAPTFPTTVGATVTDGGVTWKNIGADDPDLRHVVPSTAYGQILVDPHRAGWSLATGTTTPYLDFNGYRYHVVIFDNGHRFAKSLREGRITLSGNFRGIEDVGDGSGALISAPSRILQHFWTNFVENSYKTGGWFAVPTFGAYSLFDTTKIEAVKTYTDTLVGGGPMQAAILIGEGGKQVGVFEVIKQMASSWDLRIAENRHGQIVVGMDNPSATPAVTFTQQDDTISITTALRRSGYANVVRYRYGYRYVPPVATQLEGEQNQPLPADPVHAYSEWASGLQEIENTSAITQNYGRRVYLDLELYGVRDQATADAIAARVLARAIGPTAALEGPIGVRISTGLQGLAKTGVEVDVFSVVGLDHIEGLGASGYVNTPMLVEEIEVSPDGCSVTLSGLLQPPTGFGE